MLAPTGLGPGAVENLERLVKRVSDPLAPLAPFRGEGPGVRGGLMCKLETRFVAFPRAHPPHPQPFSPTKPGEKGARASVEPRTAQVPQSSMPDGFSSAQLGPGAHRETTCHAGGQGQAEISCCLAHTVAESQAHRSPRPSAVVLAAI